MENLSNNPLLARFETLLAKATDFRVDGLTLAKTLLTEEVVNRLEQLLFNEASLCLIKTKASRIEFIADGPSGRVGPPGRVGPLPPELLDEPSLKQEPIYKQVIAYHLCKACRLCIEVCPKHVYKDDGFGRPGIEDRREEECTGLAQCGQCADICPENAIHIAMANPVFQSTLFVLLPHSHQKKWETTERDFFVANPLNLDAPLKIEEPVALPRELNPKNLAQYHRLLNESGFYPLLETKGYPRHFVDSKDPQGDLRIWAKENSRDPALVFEAIALLYGGLPQISRDTVPPLKQGKYLLDKILCRLIDEIIHTGIKTKQDSLERLKKIVREAFMEEPFSGAKTRPIGGLLPPATSIAWKTPYGEEIPNYVHMEKCLGPECGLCVTHCPEGGGGNNSAIRMVLKVPQGTIPTLVRGLDTFLLRCDGSHRQTSDLEDLRGKTPFEFEVDPDFCKACGICIACCPHDVIEPMTRRFDLRAPLSQGSATQGSVTRG